MKKGQRILILLMVLFLGLSLISCGEKQNDEEPNENPNTGEEQKPGGEEQKPTEITEQMLQDLKFESATVEYTGGYHSIYVENIYEADGVTVKYKNNDKTSPGTYEVVATIEYKELKVEKKATLEITKKKANLTADAEQTFYMGDEIAVQYQLDNDKQTVVMKNEKGQVLSNDDFARAGTYNVVLYSQEDKYHAESNHVNVKVVVLQSAYNVTFESKKVVADGKEHALELTGTLPEGFTVEYENNKGTVDGKYFAVANIKNASGEVVEKHCAVLEIDNPENKDFAKYLDEFLVTYLEDDQLSVNIFCENPADFGLEHYDATWYAYERFTDAELAEDLKYFEELLADLEKYEGATLNNYQEIAYKNVYDFLNYYIDFYSIEDAIFMQIQYVDQFGGYVADFGTYMEAYSLRSEQEVKDIVSFIQSTDKAFASYLDFVQDKLDKGYGLSDYTITEMRGYLKDLLDAEEGYYLVDILNYKVDGLTFLTDGQKTDYKKQIADAVDNNFMPGVKTLYEGLNKFIGTVEEANEGYWAVYENGKDLYEMSLADLLGYKDLDMEKYIADIDAELMLRNQEAMSKMYDILLTYNLSTYEQLESMIKRNSILDGTPDEMMVYLKEFAKTIVPDLNSNPDIVIKEMDEASAKVSNALAYYMKSALDNTSSEYITLNPVTLLTNHNNEIIGTLAHEGYPGHLYAYVFSKEQGLPNISKVMSSVAHGEGWATYVQLKLYEYAKEQKGSDNDKFIKVMDYLYANQLSSFLLETRLDVGIHYEGWTVKEVGAFLKKLGYDESAAQSIYDLIIETATQYASYGYGKYIFVKLHEDAQKVLGKYYNEIEFNTMLLSNGWVGLETLEAMYEEYIEVKCFEYGIER